jgi:diphosphomevalonate decarboxylase
MKPLLAFTARVPAKVLLFGEYGLLSGGAGFVLTLPDHACVVRVELDSATERVEDEATMPRLRVESAFFGDAGPLVVDAAAWSAWRTEVERGIPAGERAPGERDARFFLSILFPYGGALRVARISAVRVFVLRAFSPSLGFGSSSAITAGIHAALDACLGLPASLARALASVRLFQGRGSGYDVAVQRAAEGTLSPRLWRVTPQGNSSHGDAVAVGPAGPVGPAGREFELADACVDLSSAAFDMWRKELATGIPGFAILPSRVYAPTAEILDAAAAKVTLGNSSLEDDHAPGAAHADLAAAWEATGFALRALPDLFARSRAVARRQGLFGAAGGPFARICAVLEEARVCFKTTGAGHGDSLLAILPVSAPRLAYTDEPLFRLEESMAHSLPPRLARLQEALSAARRAGLLHVQAGDLGHASAPSNIALVKYWGKEPGQLQVPVNSSVSYTLGGFRSFTRVEALASLVDGDALPEDFASQGRHVMAFGRDAFGAGARFEAPDEKVSRFLARLLDGVAPDLPLAVSSWNNFPTACGIASSASGLAALTGALCELLDVERHLGTEDARYWRAEWARIGSGSATRSTCDESQGRYVAWERAPANTASGNDEPPCKTTPWIAGPELSRLGHGVVVFDAGAKDVSSSEGHLGASSSPFQAVRVAGVPAAMACVRAALASDDFAALARVTEADAFAMHAVMQTSLPAARYFGEATSRFLCAFVSWRDARGVDAFWTLDAGPNAHLLFLPSSRDAVVAFVADYAREVAANLAPRSFLENGTRGPAGLVAGRQAFETLLDASDLLLRTHSLSDVARSGVSAHADA